MIHLVQCYKLRNTKELSYTDLCGPSFTWTCSTVLRIGSIFTDYLIIALWATVFFPLKIRSVAANSTKGLLVITAFGVSDYLLYLITSACYCFWCSLLNLEFLCALVNCNLWILNYSLENVNKMNLIFIHYH